MARKGGWRRAGSRRHFRYEDAKGRRITDRDQLGRIESLRLPPAWKDVWISPRPGAKLQATGVDAAGRRQYLYHPAYRAKQEQAKYDKLVRFAAGLPELRAAMAEHLEAEEFTWEWTSALAVRLINIGWFRVGSERYTKRHRTFGITTLKKNHNDYIQEHMGEDFTAKDFRTWGGTLIAAVLFAEHDDVETFALAICASSAHAISSSTWKNGRCSRFYVRGAFASRALPRRISTRISIG